jgi:phenylalanyl-tRNA synthetase beta chain
MLHQAHEVLVNGRAVAVIGTVSPKLLKTFDLAQEVHFAECDEVALLELCRAEREVYAEVPRHPSVRRDLSLLIGQELRYEQLKGCALQAERKLLKEVGLFDVFQGDRLPDGKKSYAMSFVLQDAEKTLTDEQVDKAMGRIRQALEKELGAELRS